MFSNHFMYHKPINLDNNPFVAVKYKKPLPLQYCGLTPVK